MKENKWIPVLGELINVGIPSICLEKYIFISITGDGKYLYWNQNKTKALVVDPEFCFQIEE